ncbi:hypothetical protein GCM10028811_34810 [Uliginosibacterium sediminicola]
MIECTEVGKAAGAFRRFRLLIQAFTHQELPNVGRRFAFPTYCCHGPNDGFPWHTPAKQVAWMQAKPESGGCEGENRPDSAALHPGYIFTAYYGTLPHKGGTQSSSANPLRVA